MDSKLRRMAILSSMAMILLVSLLVLYSTGPREAAGIRSLLQEEMLPLPKSRHSLRSRKRIQGRLPDRSETICRLFCGIRPFLTRK